LAGVWRRQQEKEVLWMRSLLEGMHNDSNYMAAKAKVGSALGLRSEELGACSPTPCALVCLLARRRSQITLIHQLIHQSIIN
jgi:hypothetical protein